MSDRVLARLTGVYHADGGVRGELRYVFGKVLGTAHCALCDITHGRVRRKREWDAFVAGLPVPFDAVHLNERSAEVRAATEGLTPCVVAHTADGVEVVLAADDLDRAGGEVVAFRDELTAYLARRGLALP